jgi:hypothetical protein
MDKQFSVHRHADRALVILSGRDADYLHERFPMGSCLAVLNMFEVKQKNVRDMVFRSLQKKTIDRDTRILRAGPA